MTRIIYHAPGGGGLGHVVRLTAVASRLRLRQPFSHALFLLEPPATDYCARMGFASMILPQDPTAPHAGLNQRNLTLPRRLVVGMAYQAIGVYDPDLVVFDTHPPVSLVRQLAKEGRPMAMILRQCRRGHLHGLMDSGALARMQQIIIPHTRADFAAATGEDLFARLVNLVQPRFVGPIVREIPPFDDECAARLAAAGIAADDPFVLVAAGGSGYPGQLDALREAVRSAIDHLGHRSLPLKLLTVRGPFNRVGEARAREPIIDWFPNLPSLFARASVVVSHGGYNSVHELLASGAKAVICPVERMHEDQAGNLPGDTDVTAWQAFTGIPKTPELARCLARLSTAARPPLRTFDGAERAAEALVDAAGQRVQEQPLRLGWSELLDQAETRRDFGGDFEVFLSHGSDAEIERRAQRVLALFEDAGWDSARLILSYLDDRDGARLPDIASGLSAQTIGALIALVSETSGGTSEAYFTTRERLRRLTLPFVTDISSAAAPILALPTLGPRDPS